MDLNNCSKISNESGSVEQYLARLQDQTDITMIPAVVMMAVFSLTGLVGNSLVLVVYSHKFKLSPTKVLIMTIAIFDLVANLAATPIAMYTMFVTWNYQQAAVCKATVFLAAFTAVGGAISLTVVAVVRYRKVCQPHGWQVSIKQATVASLVAFLVAFIVSIPYILIYGVHTKNTPCPLVTGSDCFVTDFYMTTNWPLLNNLLFFVLYLALSVAMVVLYIRIGMTAWRHRRRPGVYLDRTRINAKKATEEEAKPNAARRPPTSSKDAVNQSHEFKEEKVVKSQLQALLCCSAQQKADKVEEESQCSGILKNYTVSTDSGCGDPHSEDSVAFTNRATEDCLEIPEQLSCSQGFSEPSSCDSQLQKHESFRNVDDGSVMPAAYCATNTNVDECTTTSFSSSNTLGKQERKASKSKTSTKVRTTTTTPAVEVKSNNIRPMGKMTAMLSIISAIFVLGFLPFLILTVVKNKMADEYYNMSLVGQTFFNLFYRLYFLNSAANPIIYSLCDVNFRRECIRLITCRSRGRN